MTTTEVPDDRNIDDRHPRWCSAAHCTAPDRLAERGQAEQDLPLYLHGSHLSDPIVVDITDFSELRVELQAERWVYEPFGEEIEGINLTLILGDRRLSVTVTMPPSQLPAVIAAFGAINELVERAGGES
ncbi:MAG TPA: hypothetical protein VGP91_11865 [Actinoplanes sp.]|jgi:hypothetical protein|nr:hypothetical protein [Actinoplanes sp.]